MLLAISLTPSTHAASNLEQQRQLYQEAKKLLQTSKLTEFYSIKAQLINYPLYPYLEKADLEKRFSKLTQHHIDLYAQQFHDIPANQHLQQRWLSHLAKNSKWKAYLKAFDSADATQERYECLRRTALLKTGATTKALADIDNFWNVAHSRHDACDQVFDYWIKHKGGPSSELAFQRFWKAVEEKNLSLANYLKRFIKHKDQRTLAATLLRIRNKPSIVAEDYSPKGDTLETRLTYRFGIDQLSRKQPAAAAKLWLKVRSQYNFTKDVITALNRKIAYRLYHSKDKETDQLLADINTETDEEIQVHRIKLALIKQNWEQVYKLIDQLTADQQQQENWTYWKTIAASHTRGMKPTYSDAFIELSKARSYYGLLAANILNTQFRLNPLQHKADPELIKTLKSSPAFIRMRELYYNQELYLARREWNRALEGADTATIHAASTIAHQWDWHAQAIRGVAKAQYWDDIQLRFPLPHSSLFTDKSRHQKIDTNWARAVARQESAYQPTARSHVGARGLMQLMPRTAQVTAKKNKIPYRRTAQLYSPETNISLGTAYLAEMQKKFDNNQVYATAAYNAGPHRVSRWLKERGKLPIDIWIETIPFNETRKYVMNVIAYHAVYRTLAGQPSHILNKHTAFNLAMQHSSGANQAKQLRDFIHNKKESLTIKSSSTSSNSL